MKTLLNSIHRKGGFTYMTVIVTMIVVGLMLAAYLKLIDVQNQLTMRSQAWNRSVPVIEAGIEEAMAHLNRNGSPDAAGIFDLTKLALDGWAGDPTTGWTKWRTFDNDIYFVKIDPWVGTTTNFPMVHSTGLVAQLPAFALGPRLPGIFLASIEDLVRSGKYSRRVVQCTTTNNPTFSRGLVAKKKIDLNGKNVETDSYDSVIPAYNTNGRYDINKRRDRGDIASNDTITNSVEVGNATVRGSVATGPMGTVKIGTLGVVGDSAYVDNPANRGTIQDGHSKDDMNVEFVDVPIPNIAWSSLPSATSTTTIDGREYKYVLNGGDYRITGGDLTDSIYINGPVRIRVDTGINYTGNEGITISTNGSLKLFADCETANIGGKGIINDNGSAIAFYYFGSARNKSLLLGGNGDFTGVIYAPYADLELNGSGNPLAINDFSGAAMINSAKFNGNFRFHYDEALPRIGLWRGFTITSWSEK